VHHFQSTRRIRLSTGIGIGIGIGIVIAIAIAFVVVIATVVAIAIVVTIAIVVVTVIVGRCTRTPCPVRVHLRLVGTHVIRCRSQIKPPLLHLLLVLTLPHVHSYGLHPRGNCRAACGGPESTCC
jgi:hypothetical protein